MASSIATALKENIDILRTSLLNVDIDLLTTNPTASPLFPYLTVVTVVLVANTLFRLTRTHPAIPFHVPVPEGNAATFSFHTLLPHHSFIQNPLYVSTHPLSLSL
jgi:hypothetical protein